MLNIFTKFFSPIKGLERIVEQINNLEFSVKDLTDIELRAKSEELKKQVQSNGKSLDDFLPEAFALVRESAKRTLKQRHYDVQLMGGIVLHQGRIAEMMTGEGKTLVATAPVYLNALAGKGVHVVTVNEYLAKRDTVWMGQIYHALGMKVACLIHDNALLYDPEFIPVNAETLIDKERDTTGSFLVQEEFLRPISRKEAYQADILYGTNHEFGFDYLRDNLAYSKEQQVQREPYFAIIDEVDSILIDEARTPLIISAPDQESSQFYKTFSRLVKRLEKDIDYIVDEKLKSADITASGIDKVEKELKIENIYAPENMRLTHYLQECLRAQGLFQLDKDYVVKDGEIIIVDQFTGRLMHGRRYSGGLHQAIEAKEGLAVQNESRTYAQVSIQNYFRLYKKLAGMTGTAQTSAEEFDKVYKLEVVSIPTNRENIRKDQPDLIYKNLDAKYEAIIKEIKQKSEAGQPLLVGTVSIEKNEELSRRLSSRGIKHEVLNAKNNEREAAIIAQAGKSGAITIATNMAGRGVDIILGGNPPDILNSQKVKDLGGLHVIGTERHEARRIDNQLRGRAARQGDPGSSQFYLSLEDDLMRVFGGERIKNLMTSLKVPEDQPIESGMVTRAVLQAQSKIEGMNFDARKHLLDYDDVLNKQRQAVYKMRQEMLEQNANPQILQALDFFWMTHLDDMEHLSQSVRLRAYGQHDPLVEYRREGHKLYQEMMENFEQWKTENLKTQNPNDKQIQNIKLEIPNTTQEKYPGTGRNDPCPCGSGKKYKKCHGA
ncbi:MAG: preprotein translocase subunit SecA [Patescibacteria group bacterium]